MDNYITEADILDEAKENFLTFAEEVLTERAIPMAEDGLLSVNRKILWTLENVLKMTNKSKTKKSASIVGSTLSSSYFHSDASCYGALCKMYQPFLMRYPLIDGQGALGTQESNSMVSHMRYTEAKPSKFADLMMENYEKDVVDKVPTYNNEYLEPVVLPSILPNALINGREAIAVSMAHNSLPHNLTEVCNAIIAFIESEGRMKPEDVINYITGPDFPLGNVVVNSKDIQQAFLTGKSAVSLKVRGDYAIEGNKIIFTSLPYRVYRDKLKEKIEKNVDELDKYIDDFSDESNLGNNKLVFTVKSGITAKSALKAIFKYTDLQSSLSYNMNYIVHGTPKLCSMLDLIRTYCEHQNNVLTRAAKFDKDKAEKRIHILEGLLIAVDRINEVIELIKKSENRGTACKSLIDFLSIDEIQANAILDMKLARLTKINKQELIDEKKNKELIVAECKKIIEDEVYRNDILKKKVIELRDKYGDERRTVLMDISDDDEEMSDVIPQDCIVTISNTNKINRISANLPVQKRNSRGKKISSENLTHSIDTNTADNLMFLTNKGKAYQILVNDIPEGTNKSKGTPISNLIAIGKDEEIEAKISFNNNSNNKQYALFFTKKGMIKKTAIDEYKKVKRSSKGVPAIKFKEGDSFANVTFANDDDEILVITKNGMSIRFGIKDIRPIGREACGVRAIKLLEGDEIAKGITIEDPNGYVGILTENGYGKKCLISDFPSQKRDGKGNIVYKPNDRTGNIIDTLFIGKEDNQKILLSKKNGGTYINSSDFPLLSRLGIGNKMIK